MVSWYSLYSQLGIVLKIKNRAMLTQNVIIVKNLTWFRRYFIEYFLYKQVQWCI